MILPLIFPAMMGFSIGMMLGLIIGITWKVYILMDEDDELEEEEDISTWDQQ